MCLVAHLITVMGLPIRVKCCSTTSSGLLNRISLFIGLQHLHIFCIKFLKYLDIAKLKNKYLAIFYCIIIYPIRSGGKFAFSEEIREKHIGFREIGQGKFVLLKQKSGEFFLKVQINPVYCLYCL